jgi:signal transduction histidine kinase
MAGVQAILAATQVPTVMRRCMTKPSWTILLVDATLAERALYRRYLKHDPVAEYYFWEAGWGALALALCQARQPDCVVLDYGLPDLDGLMWLTRLQAQARALAPPVILLLDIGSEALAVEAMQQGAQDYLVKAHLSQELLCRAVRHAIEQATLRRTLEAHRQQVQEREAQVRRLEAALHHERAERQRAEEAGRRLEQAAQQAAHFARLGRLAAGVSHEIRNPLASIFLHVDLLEEELGQPSPDNPAGIAQCLTEIKTQLVRLEELVQEYLSLVRVASIQRTPQELGAAVQTWADEVQERAAARRVTVRCEGLTDLGQVAFHPSTLRRAVLNLVQNALDAMPHGGTLTLAGQATATHIHLHVQDTGLGIPAERLEQIFEPLYTTKPGGTGLGLYIVQEIVAAHEGQVTGQSTEGQGTTFTITLPRAPGGAMP